MIWFSVRLERNTPMEMAAQPMRSVSYTHLTLPDE